MKAVAGCLVAALLWGCARLPGNGATFDRANAQETLMIRLSAEASTQFVRTFQGDATVNDAKTQIRVTPLYGPLQTVNVADATYVRALDDARRKASAIARRIGVPLGTITQVVEMKGAGYGGNGGFAALPVGMDAVKLAATGVSTSPNQPVILAVQYGAHGKTIAVFGMSRTPSASIASEPVTGVSLFLQARGSTVREAAKRLQTVELDARKLARSLGATARDVVVRDVGFFN